jgi:Lar family restriction alleviation protein
MRTLFRRQKWSTPDLYKDENNHYPRKERPMSETKEPELLPCPFCGGTSRIKNSNINENMCWHVFCKKCNSGFEFGTKDEMQEKWNRRVLTSAPQWTAEPPKEEGWYFYYIPYCGASPERLRLRGKKLLFDNGKPVDSFSKDNPDALWLKLELPPLPERKESDE